MPERQRRPSVVTYSEIFAPFQKSNIQDVRLGYNGKCVADSIFYILNTRKGERVMLPRFGSDIHRFLFEPIDTQTALDIEVEIRDAIDRWEPRVILDEVLVTPNHDQNKYSASIKFRIRGLEPDLQEVRIDFYSTFY